jgi:hypothetical protein
MFLEVHEPCSSRWNNDLSYNNVVPVWEKTVAGSCCGSPTKMHCRQPIDSGIKVDISTAACREQGHNRSSHQLKSHTHNPTHTHKRTDEREEEEGHNSSSHQLKSHTHNPTHPHTQKDRRTRRRRRVTTVQAIS